LDWKLGFGVSLELGVWNLEFWRMKRFSPWIIVFVVLAVLCVAFPPFHFRSLQAVREARAGAQFDATDFAGKFWTGTLLPAAEQAADAARVLEEIATNPKSVREQFGRTVGVGSSYYLFLRGEGRVVSTDDDAIGLSLKPGADEPQIVIELGFVFGNAVRDATGLIKASSYPNAQEFNDVSAALNNIVETSVLPRLQKIAQVGDRIQFVGCVEVSDEEMDLKPLKLVPIEVKELKH
jgi:predicted lipoprotein